MAMTNLQASPATYTRPLLHTPNGSKAVVLHSCCAPCSGEVIAAIVASDIALTVFFYNPNIHPRQEYEIRKQENIRYCHDNNINFVDGDYDAEYWFERVKGQELLPERGERCTTCFDMRFEVTAAFAHSRDIWVFTSCLGISRWKDMNQINASGIRASQRFDGLEYWTYNWRKMGGSQRMIAISKTENFYQQEYCGCIYSLRDTNKHRLSRGRERITRGVRYYGIAQDHPAIQQQIGNNRGVAE